MSAISTEQVKELRKRTGISVMQCKKALEEANGDTEKAIEVLKSKGKEIAAKKGGRTLAAGVIASYIHADSKIGVLLELLCETDFVARNEDFKRLADDLAMHVAAMSPEYVRESDITDSERERVKKLYASEVEGTDKPREVKEKILEGKCASYFTERVLLKQPFVREQNMTVEELIERVIQKIGEKIEVSRFVRYALLEE